MLILARMAAHAFRGFPGDVFRGASLGDFEPESLAYLDLVSYEGRDRGLRVGVLDVSYRAHLVQDRLEGAELLVELRFPDVGHVAADYLAHEEDQQPPLLAELGPVPLPVGALDPPHHAEVFLLLVPELIVALRLHRSEVHAMRRVREESGLPPRPLYPILERVEGNPLLEGEEPGGDPGLAKVASDALDLEFCAVT